MGKALGDRLQPVVRAAEAARSGFSPDDWLKPLAAGTYIFFGEYHEDTAKGHIVVE